MFFSVRVCQRPFHIFLGGGRGREKSRARKKQTEKATHEQNTLPPPKLRVLHEHLVRERHLLVVPRGQHPDLVHHPRQRARRVRPPREAEDADPVAVLVCWGGGGWEVVDALRASVESRP